MTLDSAIKNYLNSCRAAGLSRATCRIYCDDLFSLAAFLGAEAEKGRVQEEHLLAWLSWLWERPNEVRGSLLSAATIQHHYRSANTFFYVVRAQGAHAGQPPG